MIAGDGDPARAQGHREDPRKVGMAFPALFVSHGAPSAALEHDAYTRALGAWARGRPRPRTIVVVSAHREARGPVRVNTASRPSLIYDFYGFPTPLYQLTYPAPGAPDLAHEVAEALDGAGVETSLDAMRGWDHGVWVPLRLLYPAADVPVVQVSLPVPRTPELLLTMGRALAPLRERGVLLFGSGGVVHNLGMLRWDGDGGAPEPWAEAFDSWVRDRLLSLDVEALREWEARAPHGELAAPTSEHFDPLLFVLGARTDRDRVEDVYEGFRYGSLSLRSFALATP
jgi:4,5-DOPA dioxygenase extradiol